MLPALQNPEFQDELNLLLVQLIEKLDAEAKGHEANCARVFRDTIAIELSTEESNQSNPS